MKYIKYIILKAGNSTENKSFSFRVKKILIFPHPTLEMLEGRGELGETRNMPLSWRKQIGYN